MYLAVRVRVSDCNIHEYFVLMFVFMPLFMSS